MSRRGKTAGRATRARRGADRSGRKPALIAPGSARRGTDPQIDTLKRELAEAREREDATGEVLRLVSASPGELKPVFAAILEKATRLCHAKFGTLYLIEQGVCRVVAMHNAPPALAEFRRRDPVVNLTGNTLIGRVARAKRAIMVTDMCATAAARSNEQERRFLKMTGAHSVLTVPMLRGNDLVGMITVFRQEIRPFAEAQVELLRNFATQALIAIENTRLFNELRQRTTDLSEALEQQTATSQVLGIISGSPGELAPVFHAILENATRICDAKFGNLWLREGNRFRISATYGAPRAYREYFEREPVVDPDPRSGLGTILKTKAAIRIDDIKSVPTFKDKMRYATINLAKARSLLGVPLLKDGAVIGVIAIYRQEVRPFPEKQIELLTNFAAQAVIAIENTWLLSELRESLEQQTATSEVLKVISSSPGELQPVFLAMLENAARICGGAAAILFSHDDGAFTGLATVGVGGDFTEYLARGPIRPGPHTGLRQLIETKQTVHIVDPREGQAYADGDPWRVATAEMLRAGSLLNVPMMKDGQLIGAIGIYRHEIRPFSDKQIELVTNFAAQAVIAIENTRLLNELRRSLEQQTATADVLRVISASPGDLQPVFQVILENATRICQAKFGQLFLVDDGVYRAGAMHNLPPDYLAHRQAEPRLSMTGDSAMGRVARTKRAVQIVDIAVDRSYQKDEQRRRFAALTGARTIVSVPMLKDDELVGAINVYRDEVRAFSENQVELLSSFAAQAVIAIENTRLLNELRQSLEQQTATADVLRVISSSPGDLEPVFQAILENATRICEASFGTLMLRENDEAFRRVALHNAPADYLEFAEKNPFLLLSRHPSLKRIAQAPAAEQIADMSESEPDAPIVKLGHARTLVNVPMLKDDELVGVIGIYRREVRPFTNKQVELLKNFAAQAVIAIENARLLDELRQRTTDLAEALDQQTATSEVLEVISSSPGELGPVFRTMLENATRICEAKFGLLFRFDGNAFESVAEVGTPPELTEFLRRRGPFRPIADGPLKRVLDTMRLSHTADYAADNPSSPAVRFGGARSTVDVPLIKDDVLVGAFSIYRQEVRAFTDKQIELIENFAAQAVIAIENARLLNELRQRTDDLSEALEQQTATAEVLRAISSSPGELGPVFDSMLANATRLCEASFGGVFLREGDDFRIGAVHMPEQAHAAMFEPGVTIPISEHSDLPLTRVVTSKDTCQIVDLRTSRSYADRNPRIARLVELAGARTFLCVPMIKDNDVVGAFAAYRTEVRPFADKQIELIENFAAQAVIAIENARLLNELRESLQQQTATADVLKVISRSTFNLQTVLDTLVRSAAQLCRADRAAIRLARDSSYHHVASYGFAPGQREYMIEHPLPARPDRSSLLGRILLDGKLVHIVDTKADPEFKLTNVGSGFSDVRTGLGVPLLREGEPIGLLILTRRVVAPFSEKQIALVTTFADQAVIAIENVRLFDEIQDKSRQLEEASKHKSQFLANMSHELRTPLNAILGYTEMILDGIYGAPPDKMRGVMERVQSNGKHLLGLINDVLDLSKIEAGQLVLSIEDYSIMDIVQGVYSTVEPLATTKKLGFSVEMPPNLPAARGDDRRLKQVLLNLVGNAIKFTDSGEVGIKASAADGSYTIAVHDTGPGISAADQVKIFEEFQQADNSATKKKGGTGLGLSIAKRIVEMHGGRLWVESSPGNGSTFSFTVPLKVEQQARPS